MAKHASSMYKRSITALGVSAALMMALTGCLGGGNDTPQEPVESSAQQSSGSSAKDAAIAERGGDDSKKDDAKKTESAEASAEPSKEAASEAAKEPVAAGELTPPGTALKFGEIAKTRSNSGKQGDEKYKEATFDTTVTKIVPGDPADLAKLEGAAKFAGQTPYYVFFESKLTSLSKPSAGMSDAYLDAHLKDGTKAQKLIVFGTLGDCKSGSFETEGKDDTFSYVVGSTKSSCSVFLAPSGDAVSSASYSSSSYSYEKYSDNEYNKNPITWGK